MALWGELVSQLHPSKSLCIVTLHNKLKYLDTCSYVCKDVASYVVLYMLANQVVSTYS